MKPPAMLPSASPLTGTFFHRQARPVRAKTNF
jgi:hypothetical protein